MSDEERRVLDGPDCPGCGRTDWTYDAEFGMWCVGCGYVKRATGTAFKERRYKLDKNHRAEKQKGSNP